MHKKVIERTRNITERQTDGRTDRKTDRQTEGRTKCIPIIPSPLRGGGLITVPVFVFFL
jgi:hypothetical protein